VFLLQVWLWGLSARLAGISHVGGGDCASADGFFGENSYSPLCLSVHFLNSFLTRLTPLCEGNVCVCVCVCVGVRLHVIMFFQKNIK